MKLFKDVGAQCSKCTGASVSASFSCKMGEKIIEESMLWTCKICGYSWFTHPADYDDGDHAS